MKSYISRIEVNDYKGIDHEVLENLNPNINVVVGNNNSGKTRIVEYLRTYCTESYEQSFKNVEKSNNSETAEPTIEWRHIDESINNTPITKEDSIAKTSLKEQIVFISYEGAHSNDTSLNYPLDSRDRKVAYREESMSPHVASLLKSLEEKMKKAQSIRKELNEAIDKNEENIHARRELSQLRLAHHNSRQTIRSLGKQIEEIIEDEQAIHEENRFIATHSNELKKSSDRLRRCRDDMLSRQDEELYIMLQEFLALPSSEQRKVHETVDTYCEKERKANRQIEIATHNLANSRAAFETVTELEDEKNSGKKAHSNRLTESIISIVLPIAFLCTGIPLTLHGLDINSLSITSLGVAFAIFALFLAIGAFVLLARRPGENEYSKRKRDAEWILKQDEKKLKEYEEALIRLQASFEDYIRGEELSSFAGTPRQIKIQIKNTKEYGKTIKELENRISSLDVRIASLQSKISVHRKRINAITSKYHLEYASLFEMSNLSAFSIDEEMNTSDNPILKEMKEKHDALLEKRDALVQTDKSIEDRIEYLEIYLAQERDSIALEEIKYKEQANKEQCRRLKNELIVQIIGELIEDSFIEDKSFLLDEHVLSQASMYLSRMVGSSCELGVQGSILFSNDEEEHTIDIDDASTSLKQMVYLSRQFALLDCSLKEASLPIVLDDSLILFDAVTKKRVLDVIEEISKSHQVILFSSSQAEDFFSLEKTGRGKIFTIPANGAAV